MCGIAGVACLAGSDSPSRATLAAMANQLIHRGPDGEGTYLDERVGLTHRRLSIIDLESGDQPIHNEDKSVWVVFNGEIFNFIELRASLVNRGHKFYTRSDTEVIVHLYEEHGEDFVDHLNGQFSIALWDNKRRKLILTRDRAGILPLYYQQQSARLLFASEIKSILAASRTAPRLNLEALDQLMTFWAPLSPATVFEGIREISPGEIMVVTDGQIKKRSYWSWSFPEHGEYRGGNTQDLAGELRDLLIDATRIRLRSDVPVGAYLSGGLDSSILVSLIKRHGNVPLRTFSLSFDDDALDESRFQKELVEYLQADHSQVKCRHEDIADRLEQAIWHTEAPVLRTAPVPMNMLSQHVHQQGYKVVLTGEGADEVFGGYDIFKENKVRRFWAKYPDSLLRPMLLKRLYPYLDDSLGRADAYLKRFFGVALATPDLPSFSHMPRWASTAQSKNFISPEVRDSLSDKAIEKLEKSLPDAFGRWHPFNQAQYLEAKTLMAGYLLCSQGDRMLMSNSVEGRFPFLDHRVIEFANSLHPNVKMKVLNEKHLLKVAMREYVPQSILKRHKQPYRAPDIPAFFSDRRHPYVESLLAADTLKSYGYFDSKKVRLLLKKIKNGQAIGHRDNVSFVAILSTQIWHHHFIENFHKNFSGVH